MKVARSITRRTLTARPSLFLAPRASYIASSTSCLRMTIPQRYFNSSSVRFQEEAKAETKAEEPEVKAEAEAEAEANTAEKSSEEATVDVAALQAELAECKQKVADADKELKDMKDKMLRNLAEMENVRGRARKDVDNAKNFALQGFAKKMLDTTDNLGWALTAAKEGAEAGDNADLKTLYDGVVLTETTLLNTLKSVGVERFDSLGEKFDPNLHDGLFQFQDPTKEAGTVGQVMKEGWMYNGRCIRPANVGTVTE